MGGRRYASTSTCSLVSTCTFFCSFWLINLLEGGAICQ